MDIAIPKTRPPGLVCVCVGGGGGGGLEGTSFVSPYRLVLISV